MTEERLQKVLARAGVGSRRKAETFITAGRVAVNGAVVRELGVKVDPATDEIEVDGEPIEREVREYWAVHKPAGVITTVDDPWGRTTARELVPTSSRVYPVGRLDADSSGLLLFTNDGDLAFHLTHPRFEHEKEYWVRIDRRPDAATIRRLRRGVELDGLRTAAAQVDIVEDEGDGVWLRMILREGRKRQIRKMLDLVGHPVRELVRVRIGPVLLGDLPEGTARRLSAEEAQRLRGFVRRRGT
jgi:23S rRNA pseudouridine2605 synthase